MLRYQRIEKHRGEFCCLPSVKTENKFLLPISLEGSTKVAALRWIPAWALRSPFTWWQGAGSHRCVGSGTGCLLCLICAVISAQRQLAPDAAYQCLLFSVVSCWEMGPTKGRGRERWWGLQVQMSGWGDAWIICEEVLFSFTPGRGVTDRGYTCCGYRNWDTEQSWECVLLSELPITEFLKIGF